MNLRQLQESQAALTRELADLKKAYMVNPAKKSAIKRKKERLKKIKAEIARLRAHAAYEEIEIRRMQRFEAKRKKKKKKAGRKRAKGKKHKPRVYRCYFGPTYYSDDGKPFRYFFTQTKPCGLKKEVVEPKLAPRKNDIQRRIEKMLDRQARFTDYDTNLETLY